MADIDAGQERLAGRVKDRRMELGLSMREAASLAGITWKTFKSLETGQRRTAAFQYARIERMLRWETGSIEDILAGGEPRSAPAPQRREPTPYLTAVAEVADEMVTEIQQNPDLDIDERVRAVELVVDMSTRIRRRLRAVDIEHLHAADTAG